MKKKIFILLLVIIVFVVLKNTGIFKHLTFENLKQNKNIILEKYENNKLIFMISYVLLYIVVVGFSLPGAAIMTLAGGFIFGTFLGVVLVNIGATLGSVLVFIAIRYLIGNWIQNKYKDKLLKFNKTIKENGYSYLLTLRLIPVFPFFLINILSALTKIPLWTFTWTTAVGIIPGSFAYAYAGQQLDHIDSLKDIISLRMLSAFILLGLVALLPAIIKFLKKIKRSKYKNSFW